MIFEKLASLIAEQFNVDADSITMDTSFTDDLNADSVDIVDLSMALEEEFGIEELDEEEPDDGFLDALKGAGDWDGWEQDAGAPGGPGQEEEGDKDETEEETADI